MIFSEKTMFAIALGLCAVSPQGLCGLDGDDWHRRGT